MKAYGFVAPCFEPYEYGENTVRLEGHTLRESQGKPKS